MAFTEPGEPADFTGLRALFINCTLKRSPEPSNTQGLIDISTGIMDKHGVEVEVVRAVDHDIATGVWPDMREHGWDTDDWPAIFERVLASDILVLAGPIWLGDNSSVMKKVRVSFPCRRRLFADEWETVTVCAVCMPCDSHVISLTISKRQRSGGEIDTTGCRLPCAAGCFAVSSGVGGLANRGPRGLTHMHHLIGQQSLTSGWLPVVAQLITLVSVGAALGWRSPRWSTRWVPVAVLVGVAAALAVDVFIGSIGVAGGPVPRWLLWWVGLTGFAGAVGVAGWRGARWWRRGIAVVSVPACVLCAALVLNEWVGYFPTVHTAWNQLSVGPLPDETDRMTVTAMQLTGVRPGQGVVVPVTISAAASQFRHRDELVYLPPAWFAANPPPRLPVVMMIGAQLNTPADWLRAGGAVQTIDEFARAHGGDAPVFVFVDATGAFDNDTECVNGSRGNASYHLTKDVVPYMISNFGVSADRSNWAVLGWSMGGTCALDLAVRRPELFSAFVDIAGDVGPNSGDKAQTIARLFGGDANAWAAFDPATVIARHGQYRGVSGLFEVAARSGAGGGPDVSNPEGQDHAAEVLSTLGAAHGVICSVLRLPGRHDWPFAAQALGAALPWLAGQLGTPGVPLILLPGASAIQRVPDTAPPSRADSHGVKAKGG